MTSLSSYLKWTLPFRILLTVDLIAQLETIIRGVYITNNLVSMPFGTFVTADSLQGFC